VTTGVPEPRHFTFGPGPIIRGLQRLHLARSGGPRTRVLVAIAWLPLCVAALARLLVRQRPQAILFDISVHARLLIVLPLLVVAARLLDERCRGAIEQLEDGKFAEPSSIARILDRAERLRDSRLASLAILAIALFAGQAVLWGLVGPTGVFAGVVSAGSVSFARIWYGCVALPIVQLLLLRYLWHWLIWSYIVVRVSRLNLATIATHPDHAAGIGFLSSPVSAFWCFVLAESAMLASAWGTQIIAGRATVDDLIPTFIAFLVLVAALAFAPLFLYIGILYRARHRETRRFNQLALDYVREFDQKWVGRRPPQELLGTEDLQALNDLIGSYASLVKVRLLPFGTRALAGIWLATVIPMLPLVFISTPVDQLLLRIGHAMLTGLPL
jgi:hypothetical protein